MNLHCLLIEDDKECVDFIMRNLGKEIRIEVRSTFAMGLAAAEMTPEPFDVVLLDLKLPDSTKEQTFARLHELIDAAQAPVHVFTAFEEPSDWLRSRAAGAKGFWPKQSVTCGGCRPLHAVLTNSYFDRRAVSA